MKEKKLKEKISKKSTFKMTKLFLYTISNLFFIFYIKIK